MRAGPKYWITPGNPNKQFLITSRMFIWLKLSLETSLYLQIM